MNDEPEAPGGAATEGWAGAELDAVQSALDACDDAAGLFDSEGQCLWLRPDWQPWFGSWESGADRLNLGGALGRLFEDRDALALTRRALDGIRVNREFVTDRVEDSHRTFNLALRPVNGPDGGRLGTVMGLSDRTTRVCIEEALRNTQVRYNSLVESAPEAILLVDPQTDRVVEFNHRAAELFGRQPDQVTSTALAQLFCGRDPALWAQFNNQLAAASEGLEPIFEWDMTGSGVEPRIYEIRLALIPGRNQQLIRASLADVSARKNAERKLEGVLQRLDFHVENTPLAVIEWDADERIVRWSGQAEEIFGWPAAEVVGKRMTDWAFVVDEDLQRVQDASTRLRTGNASRNVCHNRNFAADGRVLHCEWHNSVLVDAHGELVSTLSLVQDVTDRTLAEHAYRQSEERFRSFAEIGADWFWETDAGQKITYLSGRFGELMGGEAEHLLGRRLDRLGQGPDGRRSGSAALGRRLDAREAFEDLELSWVSHSGEVRRVRLSGRPRTDAAGAFLGFMGVGRDVTQTHELARQLNRERTYDALTGLLNRAAFEARLRRLVTSAVRTGERHVLCYLDLDQFKFVNDTCGHLAGDELLRRVASDLRGQLDDSDLFGRLGGDEFGLLLRHCDLGQGLDRLDELRQGLQNAWFEWEQRAFPITFSIGVVPITADSGGAVELMREADMACYVAKDAGRGRVHVFRSDDEEQARQHVEIRWATHINEALDQDRFELLYQPIVAMHETEPRSPHTQHCEVLLRMRSDGGELIAPGNFLPAAERYDLSTRIDRWVTESALGWLGAHPGALRRLEFCAINLSGSSLADESFREFVLDQFDRSAVAPEHICFEVTESSAIANFASASRFIQDLKRRGCQFALDDFGSGLSSFAYLKHLPVDLLKIDGAFVRDMASDATDRAMVRSINEIGQVLGKRTVAEFVESAEIARLLEELGVDYAQGYHFGRPRPLAELAA